MNSADATDMIRDIFNLKNISEVMIEKINNEISQIQNLPNLLAYFEANLNHANLEFMSGYQKYVTLLKQFNKKVMEFLAKDQISIAPTRAKELSSKVKAITSAFEESEYKRINLNYPHKQLDFHSFVNYFTKEDTAILKTIGNLWKCIKLQGSVSGQDALEFRIKKILDAIAIRGVSHKNMIGSSEKKALSMVSGACQSMGSNQ